MNKKWAPYLLILVLLIALIVVKWVKKEKQKEQTTITNTPGNESPGSTVNRDRGFDRRKSFLEYSKHATCRMKCRHISQAEVEEIMEAGKINYNKSDLQNARCPRYAIEGTTRDDQDVRIIFAQCNEKTVVVTVIDLETDFSCDCPGDDVKYKNRN